MRSFTAKVGMFNGRYWYNTRNFTVHACSLHVAAARAVQWAKKNDPLCKKVRRLEAVSVHLEPGPVEKEDVIDDPR